MKRLEFYIAIAAVVFFFAWALAAQYQVERLEKKNAKLKADMAVLSAEKQSIKSSIGLQNAAINSLSDISLETMRLLEGELQSSKKIKAEADKKIDSVRKQDVTNDCEKIRVRLIDHAVN